VNINIGNNRWIKFVRTPEGEWTGRGHGYRFRITRSSATFTTHSEQWQCRVWPATGGPVITGCLANKMKSAIQEGARRADVATKLPPIFAPAKDDDSCPT